MWCLASIISLLSFFCFLAVCWIPLCPHKSEVDSSGSIDSVSSLQLLLVGIPPQTTAMFSHWEHFPDIFQPLYTEAITSGLTWNDAKKKKKKKAIQHLLCCLSSSIIVTCILLCSGYARVWLKKKQSGTTPVIQECPSVADLYAGQERGICICISHSLTLLVSKSLASWLAMSLKGGWTVAKS